MRQRQLPEARDRAGRLVRAGASAQLCYPLLDSALLDEGFAAHSYRLRRPHRKTVLLRQCGQPPSDFEHYGGIAHLYLQMRGVNQRDRERVGSGAPGHLERLAVALDVLVGSRELAHPAQRLCLRDVGACEHRGILCAFGDHQLPLAEFARRIKLEPQYVMELQPIGDPEELFNVADALTERTSAIEYLPDLLRAGALNCDDVLAQRRQHLYFPAVARPVLGKRIEQLEPRAQMFDRFGIGETACRLRRREREIAHGFGRITAAAMMVGELGQVVVEPPSENRLDRLRRTLMQQPAPLAQDRTIGDLMRQYMLERIDRVARVGFLVNKVVDLQFEKHPLHLLGRG